MTRDAGGGMLDAERGSVTILAVAVVAVLLTLVPVIVDIGLFLNARAQAQNAADASALAAAQEFFFEGDCREAASEYAAANGARLVNLAVHQDSVIAEAEVRPRNVTVSRLGIQSPAVSGLGKAEVKFVRPLPGPVILRFGERYWDQEAGRRRTHCGIDVAAREGAPVKASAEGKVHFVGFTPSGGLTVSLQHANGIKTTYLQLKTARARKGDRVSQGEVIGEVAAAADKSSSATHLHVGALFAGEYIDPEKLFAGTFQVDLSRYIRRGDIPPGSPGARAGRLAEHISWWDRLKGWAVGLWSTFLDFFSATKHFAVGKLAWLLGGAGRLWRVLTSLLIRESGDAWVIQSAALKRDRVFTRQALNGRRGSVGAEVWLRVFDPSGDHDGFRSKTFISLDDGRGAKAVAVYDGSGRLARELGGWAPPSRGVSWDGLDGKARIVEEGLYSVIVLPEKGGRTRCQVEVEYHLK